MDVQPANEPLLFAEFAARRGILTRYGKNGERRLAIEEKRIINSPEFKESLEKWQIVNPVIIDEVIDFIENYLFANSY